MVRSLRSFRSVRGAWRFPVLVAVGMIVASSCSSSSSSGGGGVTPAATIFVQNFRYNGVPTTLSSGIVTFLFENKESFPITHEMIPIALPTGKSAQDVISAAQASGPTGGTDSRTCGCTSAATSGPRTPGRASSKPSTSRRGTTRSRVGRPAPRAAARTDHRTPRRGWSPSSP